MSERLGWMPNMYAVMGQSESGLTKYLALENGKSSLRKRESEAVKLVVSKVNESQYCLAAHTYIAKMNGFAVEQIEEIKQGSASFDSQLDALVKLAKDVTVKRGKPNQTLLKNFFEAGFDKEHLIDTLIVIGDTTISNLVNCVAQTPIDEQWKI